MRYSIGDVSRVLGMTTAALHFYEKEGIIDTPKVESGRRYYEETDVNRLISAKKYRAMGVTVRDIAQQFSSDGMTGDQVMARMREKREEASQMVRQYTGLVRDIDWLIARGEEALGRLGEVDIRKAAPMLALLSSSGGRIPLDKQEQKVAQLWLEAMPAVSVGICRDKDMEHALEGLVISAARAEEFGLDAGAPGVRFVPGGMALHAVALCGEEQYTDPDVIFKPLLAFAREHRFVQKGMMWGAQIFVDCSEGIRRHYYDTYMCFE
ncbi:MAG: MerR family transcriptional regulator [Clostridia bacterium]|nr:MerR family transcriptional regulator [Clostridia bacterium]